MAPPTRPEFARLLARLDRAAFARFVATLWTARGRPATAADGRVTVDGGPTMRVHAPPRALPAPVAARRVARALGDGTDAVATTDPAVAAALRERGVRAVGPDALRRALLYDLDRSTARRVARDHLGHGLDGPVPSLRGRALAALSSPAVVVVVVVLAAVVAVAAPVPVGSAPASDAAGAVDGPADTGDGPVPTPGAYASWPTPGDGDAAVAPGVTAAGVVDADALARAHADAVRGRSYEWTVTYREHGLYRGRTGLVAIGTRTVRVESETEFRDAVRIQGTPHTSPLPARERVVYADGSSRSVRSTANGTATVDRYPISFTSDGAGRYADRAASHVRRFAAADETELAGRVTRGGVRYRRVSLRDERHAGVIDLRGTLLVAPSGFVRVLRVAYVVPGQDRVASFTFRYAAVGATRVSAPAWYDAARNATG
ncbi:MAG: hypothetical protein ABEH47_06175 [Haloferacaceae archaeon]